MSTYVFVQQAASSNSKATAGFPTFGRLRGMIDWAGKGRLNRYMDGHDSGGGEVGGGGEGPS